MKALRTSLCLVALCGFASGAFAQQDTRALILYLEEGFYLEILPNGNGVLSKNAAEDPGCSPTGPGLFEFDPLYREFKAAASEKQRSRSDTRVAFTVGGGRAYYLQDRTRVLAQYRKAEKWITRSNPRNSCPEIPQS